ncbi:MFS transporter [Brevibacterium sp. XM4083]|uniref:MFS transporter n=2 Tax=unclassified Brevibacterium TaxID=2614124 RepID=UPI0020307BF6|nr:MFS transporter [Brevibacterium sp. XM4083]
MTQPSAPLPENPPTRAPDPKEVRTVLASGFMGTLLEYYDFMLYATAASLVFGPLFFSGLGPQGALLASFSTLAVGYLIRPLGGIILGHFGDKIGRKPILVFTLALIGVASVGIGLLPTTQDGNYFGVFALVFLRVLQGIAVGGEMTGAALMAVEHAPEKSRAFAGAIAVSGGPAGTVLAALVVATTAVLSGDDFLVWGWRVPFLLSAILVVAAFIIRLKVTESPLFEQLEEEKKEKRLPILDVFSKHMKTILIGVGVYTSMVFTQQIVTVYGLALATQNGVEVSESLYLKAGGALGLMITTVLFARLSDRIGTTKVLMMGAVAGGVLAIPILLMLSNGTVWGFVLAILLGNVIIQGALYGPFAAFIARRLPTAVRFTGTALVYNIASTLGGLAPTVAAALAVAFAGSVLPLGFLWIVVALITILSLIVAPKSGPTLTQVSRPVTMDRHGIKR